MSVKVLAFFDARFQSRSADPGARIDDVWTSVLIPPLGQFQPPVGIPSVFGTYDLAIADQAASLIDSANSVGIDGFVVDCRKSPDGAYRPDAAVLAPFCGDDFELGFRWRNEPLADPLLQQADAEALMPALRFGRPNGRDGRIVLVVDAIRHIAEPARFTAMVRAAADRAGLPGLHLIATCEADPHGRLIDAGFDALVDPDPAQWHSCAPISPPTGLDFIEVAAGLKDSSLIADKHFRYDLFVASRMAGRRGRGKVLPCVFPRFSDWPRHPFEGATHLTGDTLRAYRAFLERSIVWVAAHFSEPDRLVFLESWNDRANGSEIEPSTQCGDALLKATRQGIERGRYVLDVNAIDGGEPTAADRQRRAEVEALCRAVAADLPATTDIEQTEADDPTPVYTSTARAPTAAVERTPFSIVLPTAYGQMIVNRNDINQTDALLKTGRSCDDHEIASLERILAALAADPVVVDIGANFGCFSLALSRIAGPNGKVHAFEAQRIIFNMLCGSVALNAITNVHCYNVAIGDHEGTVEIPQFDYARPLNFGSVEFGGTQREPLHQARGTDPRRAEYVQVATLDSFGFDRLDLLKIDTEGMELAVLAGAEKTIRRCKPVIFAEYLKVDRPLLRQAIKRHGYDLYRLDANYLCIPRELRNRTAIK